MIVTILLTDVLKYTPLLTTNLCTYYAIFQEDFPEPHFEPVVSLPQVPIKTLEEDEEELIVL